MSKPVLMIAALSLFLLILFDPCSAAATQGHSGPEGLYAHQMAHIFFMFAMGLLLYWLRSRRLVEHPGWRLIQYAALFFILWSADAFTVHLLEEQLPMLTISEPTRWRVEIEAPARWLWLGYVYYITKFDHLLCVPAMLFLFMGLRRLTTDAPQAAGRDGST